MAPFNLDLSDLDLGEITALYDAFEAADAGYEAILAQPRASSAVDQLLQWHVEDCVQQRRCIIHVVGQRAPTDRPDRERKGALLIREALRRGEYGRVEAIAAEHFAP